MKTTAAIFMVLPLVILLNVNRLGDLLGDIVFFVVSVFASLTCVIWGFYIYPRYRLLAWCCLITATLFIGVILGALVAHHDTILRQMQNDNTLA